MPAPKPTPPPVVVEPTPAPKPTPAPEVVIEEPYNFYEPPAVAKPEP